MSQRADVIHAGDVAADPVWIQALAWFGGLSVLLVALFHDVAGAMVNTWWTNVTYNHGFFVLPVSLWLIWLQRDALRQVVPRQEPVALVALAVMVGGWLIGRAGDVLAVEEVALVGMLIALFVFVFGREVLEAAGVPAGLPVLHGAGGRCADSAVAGFHRPVRRGTAAAVRYPGLP